ncbi:hypothetical protein GCM10009115_24850 [Sphingopyxis soli]|uniref:Uncharacterized protein n=1 Tax=Sphingopyxis soli TaxID=592051 RepID=A0ABN1M8Q2_9SPHN
MRACYGFGEAKGSGPIEGWVRKGSREDAKRMAFAAKRPFDLAPATEISLFENWAYGSALPLRVFVSLRLRVNQILPRLPPAPLREYGRDSCP